MPTKGEAAIKPSIAEKAEAFARKAHGEADHRRRYSGAPYSVHLERVARLRVGETSGSLRFDHLRSLVARRQSLMKLLVRMRNNQARQLVPCSKRSQAA